MYHITTVLQIWVNTYVNPVELVANERRENPTLISLLEGTSVSTCFSTESTD